MLLPSSFPGNAKAPAMVYSINQDMPLVEALAMSLRDFVTDAVGPDLIASFADEWRYYDVSSIIQESINGYEEYV